MIGIITGEMDWNVQELVREIGVKGKEVTLFSITEFFARVSGVPRVQSKNVSVEELECVFVRGVPGGSAEQIFFRMDVLHRLENMGVKIVNPAISIERCADKYYTCSLLEDAGIPVPETVCTERYEEAMRAFEEMKDVVVKPLFGSQGVGVMRVQDRDLAYRLFRTLEYGKSVFYVQKYIPHKNEDFRAFVLGDEVISVMRRIGKTWKTNVSQGARVERVELPEYVIDMAVKASKVVGCEYAGVDILYGDQYYVVEVNSIPGWKGLQSVTDFCVAQRIVDYFLHD